MNYIGGKYKLLPQILPLFPTNINTFVDLFCGGCNIGINVDAQKIIFNDNLSYLVDLYSIFKTESEENIFNHIESRIEEFELSLENEDGYKKLRQTYNTNRNPLDLFVLVAYSFNHQIRFNNSHEFNNPFGRLRSCFNPRMRENLTLFIDRLKSKSTYFNCQNFDMFDLTSLSKDDFVYCDPPYLITTGTYNDGKRGFTGWGKDEEVKLLSILSDLDKKGVKIALSNVIEHKGCKNAILEKWVSENNYHITYLDKSYSNSNYQTNKNSGTKTLEVLITNYTPTGLQTKLEFN